MTQKNLVFSKSVRKKKIQRTLVWNEERAKLKIKFDAKGIITCEIKRKNCWHNSALGFVHRHKRLWYYSYPRLLGDFNQVILGCNQCHQEIEYDKELTERIFNRLRGPEKMHLTMV